MPVDVSLREVEPEDLPLFFEHQNEEGAAAMAAFRPRDREAFMTHWTRILGDETVVARTVMADGAVVGNIGCWDQDGAREVGYWIGKRHWGRGIATAALGAFLDVVDERPLVAHVAEHNVGSVRVLERCGFALVERATGDDGVPELVFELA
jgi:RimJ/RimL family protein N-acetyltransferase